MTVLAFEAQHQFQIVARHDENAAINVEPLRAEVCLTDAVRLETQKKAMACSAGQRNGLALNRIDGNLWNDGFRPAIAGERNMPIRGDLYHFRRLVGSVDE